MLSGRNEWIAIGALLLWIAFVPCPYPMKEFLASPVGKLVALGVVVYAWKYLSQIVSVLILVAFLRSGSIREFLDETGMTAPTSYKCEDGFTYVAEAKMCKKGSESKAPTCNDASMMWDSAKGECVAKSTPPPASTSTAAHSGSGGPEGGTTPGAMAAKNDVANAMTTAPPTVESFTGYISEKEIGSPL